MKRGLYLLAVCCSLAANAQDYLISFAGTGASTSVTSVKVENLTAGTSINLNGSDILHLTGTVGISELEYGQSAELKIFPNPSAGYSILQIQPPAGGNAVISIFDAKGTLVDQTTSYLDNYLQEFRLSGINRGLYLINVKGRNYSYSGKLLSMADGGGTFTVEKLNNIASFKRNTIKSETKGEQSTVDMNYTTGDRLKFTGISGIYSTVITDIPATSKTISFNFIACTDGDNNNYPVVEIGTQVWMAENLKTTKFNNGADIPYKPDAAEWIALSSAGYCWYNNDAATNKNIYGALYNWYAANDSKLCPSGWHVPGEPEWTTLTTYLGGLSSCGGKMKETGTSHWYSPNTGASNSSGFTGLPGGYRASANGSGNFYEIGETGEFWTTTVSANTYPYCLYLDYYYARIMWETAYQTVGFNIRCIRN